MGPPESFQPKQNYNKAFSTELQSLVQWQKQCQAPVKELSKLININWICISFCFSHFPRTRFLTRERGSTALVHELGERIYWQGNILNAVCLKHVSSWPLSHLNTRKRKSDHVSYNYLTESSEQIVTRQVSITAMTPSTLSESLLTTENEIILKCHASIIKIWWWTHEKGRTYRIFLAKNLLAKENGVHLALNTTPM